VPDLAAVIASNVRGERARRKWRQADLAARLSVAQTTVSGIESGEREIGVRMLPALCRAFGVPLADLVRGADEDDLRAMGLL
jgi:transcriptional regulator with XRE-family HTH domain